MFQYNPGTGTLNRIPVQFPNFQNGLPTRPATVLIPGPNGAFYGIYSSYATPGMGVFKMNTDGSNLTLFPRYETNNTSGLAISMFLASDGNFRVTNYDSNNPNGDILTISPSDGTVLGSISPFAPLVGSRDLSGGAGL